MPSQAYFETDGVGDWYACIQATSAGESPTSAPDKWAKLEIPAIFESYLVDQATALLLTGEGQSDKRRLHSALAEDELMKVTFQFSERGEFERPEVLVR